MRYVHIFLLQFQEVIEDKGRIVVWFLLAAIAPLLLILFWRGASSIAGWTSADITSYYLFAIVIYTMAMCHQEDHVATIDIQEGGLSAYLLKPISYLRLIFYSELSYRLLNGFLGFLLLSGLLLFFPTLFSFTKRFDLFLLSCIVLVCAFFLTFIFKMVVGLLAFWMTEVRGAFEAVEVMIVIFSGTLMPLAFMPQWLDAIAHVLPFSYMVYFPVIAFEGKLSLSQFGQVIGMQFFWIGVLSFLYRIMWSKGLKKYTAVGQ